MPPLISRGVATLSPLVLFPLPTSASLGDHAGLNRLHHCLVSPCMRPLKESAVLRLEAQSIVSLAVGPKMCSGASPNRCMPKFYSCARFPRSVCPNFLHGCTRMRSLLLPGSRAVKAKVYLVRMWCGAPDCAGYRRTGGLLCCIKASAWDFFQRLSKKRRSAVCVRSLVVTGAVAPRNYAPPLPVRACV